MTATSFARMEASGSCRSSSGLLLRAPRVLSEAQVVCDALGQLSVAARAITANVRNMNGNLERILMDKADVEELQRILVNLSSK